MPPEGKRRVAVVTGIGAVTPLGARRAQVWSRLLEGKPPPLGRPRARDGVPVPGLASVFEPPFDLEKHAPDLVRKLSRASPLSQLAVVAATECLSDARFPEDDESRRETGAVLATCFGSSTYHLEYHEALRRKGIKGASPLLFSESVFNAASGHVSQVLRLRGPSLTLVGGEEAGLAAVARAFDRVVLGARAVIAGGVEQYGDLVHASCARAGLVGEGAGVPHGREPGPFAEGAAVLLLEDEDTARGRGARAHARVLGAGQARGAPDGSAALVRAARAALEEAGIGARDLDLVVGGACGGRIAARELEALAELLSERESPCFLAAPKGAAGEGFAYTSALQAIVGCMALCEGVVPPTPGGRESDLPPSLRMVSEPLAKELGHALVLASSDPGNAVAVVLGRAPSVSHAAS